MKGNKICREADPVLAQYIMSLDTEISHDRMINQQNKCGYGLAGVCCRLCSNGPCRLSQSRPRGVCGADADTIAGRNLLRSVAAGSACYIHVVEDAAVELKHISEEHGRIKSKEALDTLCGKFGVTGKDDWEKAGKVADLVLEDLHMPVQEQMKLVEKVAYPMRVDNWNKLGIMPGGSNAEIIQAIVKSSTNLNSDLTDMLMHCLRLSISTGVYGLVLTNLINDVIMGGSEIRFEPVGMQVIDPDCINIMVTGHQHAYFEALDEVLSDERIQSLAREAGANGIKLVGCTCVGQDFQVR